MKKIARSKAHERGGVNSGATTTHPMKHIPICPKCSGKTEKTKTLLSDGTPVMHRVCMKCKIPIASLRGVAKRIEEEPNRKATKGR